MVGCTCYPSYVRNINGNIVVQADPGKNVGPYFKTNQVEKGSSGRAPP
jgi:hypothetical protein